MLSIILNTIRNIEEIRNIEDVITIPYRPRYLKCIWATTVGGGWKLHFFAWN